MVRRSLTLHRARTLWKREVAYRFTVWLPSAGPKYRGRTLKGYATSGRPKLSFLVTDCTPSRATALFSFLLLASLLAISPSAHGNSQDTIIARHSAEKDSASLTLNDVLTVAFAYNPTFAEFTANREAADAEIMATRSRQNPSLEATLGYADGDDSGTEFGFAITQLLERPRKRAARRAVAQAMEAVVDEEEAAFMVDLRADVSKAYWAVVYGQAALLLAQENLRLVQQLVATVSKRVDAGGARPIDLTKANVELLKTKKEMQAGVRSLAASRRILNALCGRQLPTPFVVVDPLAAGLHPPELVSDLASAANTHPRLWQLYAVQRRLELERERETLSWRSDFEPRIGFDNEIDQERYFVGIGIALPLWNRNEAGIAKVEAELSRTIAQIERTRQELMRDIETAVEIQAGVYEQVLVLDELRNAAKEALRAEILLYEHGESAFISLLDMKRSAQSTEREYIDALYQWRIAQAELDQALGITGDNRK